MQEGFAALLRQDHGFAGCHRITLSGIDGTPNNLQGAERAMGEKPCEASPPHTTVEQAIACAGGTTNWPMWGDKNTANLINIGMVIGYFLNAEKTKGWRLDYDENKKLHINYEDKGGREKISIYHPVKPTLVGHSNVESVMIEYWLAWTKKHREDIPQALVTDFKKEFHATVTMKGGTSAQQLRLNGAKYALFGFGSIPGA